MSANGSPSAPIKVLLIGAGAPGSLAGALADGLLQDAYKGKLAVTVLSRPLPADAPQSKQDVLTSLKARGVKVLHANAKLEELTVALKGQDVVVSALGTPARKDQITYIDAAAKAGVQWFIPSEWGFDYNTEKGTQIAIIADVKIDDMAAIRAHGMDWTSISTGAFSEYAPAPVFGVFPDARKIFYPNTGKAALTQTALADVGNILADLIVTGRGRNETVYTATATFTYEEYANLLEKVTGKPWTRVVRTTAETEALAAASPFPIVEAFELYIGSPRDGVVPNPRAAWPVETTYNAKYGIKMSNTEDVVRKVLKV
jgi:hypothetical protein